MPNGQEQHSIEGRGCEAVARALAATVGDGRLTPNVDLCAHQQHLVQTVTLIHLPRDRLYFYFVLFENVTLDILL